MKKPENYYYFEKRKPYNNGLYQFMSHKKLTINEAKELLDKSEGVDYMIAESELKEIEL